MKIINREELKKEFLQGGAIQKAVGKDGFSLSGKMTMGYARYSEKSGVTEPHFHAEEIVHILSCENGWVRKGEEKDKLGKKIPLFPGMTLHFPPLEWHVFEFTRDGYVDMIFFFGQVDKILPEELEE